MRNPLVKIVYPPKKYIYSPPKCKVISLLYWLFIINNYLTLPYLLPFYSPGDEMHTNLYLSLLLLLDTLSNIFLLNINLPIYISAWYISGNAIFYTYILLILLLLILPHGTKGDIFLLSLRSPPFAGLGLISQETDDSRTNLILLRVVVRTIKQLVSSSRRRSVLNHSIHRENSSL